MRSRSSAWRLSLWLPAIVAAWLATLMVQIAVFTRRGVPMEADAAIVLGTAVYYDRPSPIFTQRLNHALHLYHIGAVRCLIFTGGLGSARRLAEAEVARRYALAHGVPSSQIYCETVSRFTHANLAEAAQIMRRCGLHSALIISDPLHMRRAMAMARDAGIRGWPSPTTSSWFDRWHRQAWFLIYEAVAYAGYLTTRPFLGQPTPTTQRTRALQTVETAVARPLEYLREAVFQRWLIPK